MMEYKEHYAVTGAEADVAEWWREADRIADRHDVTLSEDFGNSTIGDIVRAVQVLNSVQAAEMRKVYIKSKSLFRSIPGETNKEEVHGEYLDCTVLSKEYQGITFEFVSHARCAGESKLQGVA